LKYSAILAKIITASSKRTVHPGNPKDISMKKLLAVLVLFSLTTVLFAACGGATQTNGPNPVHMNDTIFIQRNITIKKGESITFINDVASVHVITNGTWDKNGSAKIAREPGVPTVESLVQGYGSQTIGPFNTAGTFQLYCTTHPNMNLTVIVQ
jgi:plastocyanin